MFLSSTDSNEASPAKPESCFGNIWWEAAIRSKGRLAAVTACLVAYAGFEKSFFEILRRVGISETSYAGIAISTILAALPVALYLREVHRLRHLVLTRPLTVFLGSHSFTAREKDRFFGRENEVEEVSRRLASPQLSFFILFGESGCGKTSLIRAGLMPKLESEYNFVTFCVRLYRQPERWLRATLRAEGYNSKDSVGRAFEENGRAGESNTLFDDAIALSSALGKTVVLFIDQFEEFFNNQISVEEEERVLEFVRTCLSQKGSCRVKLVFSIRSDYFDRMSLFDGFVEDVFTQTNRFRLDVFDRDRAQRVIRSSLEYSRKNNQDVAWRDGLIDTVVRDLMANRRDTVRPEGRAIVLPAELQIVCQMLQLRGTTDASQYPGKQRLIIDYVNEAIESSPNRQQTLRILQTLIGSDGRSRSEPQTVDSIAEKSGGQLETVDQHLRYLDQTCRLLTSSYRRDGDQSVLVYELAHEYLTGIILGLSGAVLDKQRRANILLQEYSRRTAFSESRRIAIRDCWFIRRYATEEISPEMNQLMRRSVRQFAFALGSGVVLAAASILAIRQGAVHVEVDYIHDRPHIVVKRGLPALKPLLGSDAVMVDTGFAPYDFLDEDDSCKSSYWIVPWAAGGEIWANHLNDCRVRALMSGMEDAISHHEDYKVREDVGSLSEFHFRDARVVSALRALLKYQNHEIAIAAASALISLDAVDDEVIATLQEKLKTEDENGVWYITRLLSRLKSNNKDVTVAILRKRLQDDDSSFDRAFLIRAIGSLNLRDDETITTLSGYMRSDDPETFIAAAKALKRLNVPIEPRLPPLRKGREEPSFLLDKIDALIQLHVSNDEIVSTLRELLREHDPAIVSTAAGDLISSGIQDSEVIDSLRRLLTVEDAGIRLSAASQLIHLKVKEDRVTASLLGLLDHSDERIFDEDVGLLRDLKPSPDEVSQPLRARLMRGEYPEKTLKAIRDFEVRDPQTVALVREMLEKPSPDYVSAAACTLIRLDLADESVWLKLRNSLTQGVNGDIGRRVGQLVDCKITDPRVVAIFRDLLSFEYDDVAGLAAEGLFDLGVRDNQIVRVLENASARGVGNPIIDAAWNKYLLAQTSSRKGEQLNELWRQLNSASAEASVVYRTAVENAIGAFAARELRDGAAGDASIERVRKLAAGWLDEKAPQHRIAASRILFHLDVETDVAENQGTLSN